MASKTLDEAKDRLGQVIKVGSVVVAPESKSMVTISRVVKISAKMVHLEEIKNTKFFPGRCMKYHDEVVCVDAIDETFIYLLTQ